MHTSPYRPQGTSVASMHDDQAASVVDDDSDSTVPRVVKRVALFLVVTLLPAGFLLYDGLIDGLTVVQATGQCSAAPPDLSPYPCSPEQYLAYRFASAWLIIGLMTVSFLCALVAAPLAAFVPLAWLRGPVRWWAGAAGLAILAVPGVVVALMSLSSIVPRP